MPRGADVNLQYPSSTTVLAGLLAVRGHESHADISDSGA